MNPIGRLTRAPIDACVLLREIGDPGHGAVLLFLGVVRDLNDGRAVSGIEYSAYEAMAASELQAIADEAAARCAGASVLLVHRLGELALQEASVAILVAHGHRDQAYQLSRWTIEELKRRVPIWKREHYADGTREWVDPAGHAREGVAS